MEQDRVDILGREEYIENVQNIITLLSEQYHGGSFAIDGCWGVGKTYVLEELERNLRTVQSEDSADDRYLVFHYNCWEYDYYEEPIIAIVSAMLDNIEDKLCGVAKESWELANDIVQEIAGTFFENKIGVDVVSIYDKHRKRKHSFQAYDRSFDQFFSFKKTLGVARKKLVQLSDKKAIIFFIDELDRCMPSYAIKILERLHHLFEGVENTILILAIDGGQLNHSIQEVYGENTDVDRYLKKFIDFKIKLEVGTPQESLFEKYKYYFDKFDDWEKVRDTIIDLTDVYNIDIRNLEKIIDKNCIIHDIVFIEHTAAYVLIYEWIWGLTMYKIETSSCDSFKDFYWIPEIDKSKYVNLDKCVGSDVITLLTRLKKSSIKRLDDQHKLQYIDEDNSDGIAFWILDKIFAHSHTLVVGNESSYEIILDKCRQFNNLGRIIESVAVCVNRC